MIDAELMTKFEDLSLPFEQWTHEAHVRVAYICLSAAPFDEALARLRRGIRAYNAANDVPESELEGYNETTTAAFLHLIDAVRRAYAEVMPVTDSLAFCRTHPQLMSKHVLRFFYSPGRRLHPDAKRRFIEPDMAPLPNPPEVRDS